MIKKLIEKNKAYRKRKLQTKAYKEITTALASNPAVLAEKKLATVDSYIGGSEHAVLHYLYSRFWHMVLFDLEIVPNPEPYQKVVHQGLITADAYMDQNGNYVDIKQVELKKINGSNIAFDFRNDVRYSGPPN